jgi:hypothetical protein
MTFLMGWEGELVILFPFNTSSEKMEIVLGKYVLNLGY